MTDQAVPERPVQWPHAPLHKLSVNGTFFVTASTYNKVHYFKANDRLKVLHRGLLSVTAKYKWQLEAWAVISNHYHFVGHSPDANGAASLPAMLRELHSKTAIWVNKLDSAPERQVWFNYRETLLAYSKSYMARLNYTHQNAVKHGLVDNACSYPYCSVAWFERVASPTQLKIIQQQKVDLVKVYDPFDAVWER